MTVAFSESDITKVKVGQSATVTLDALSGVQLGAHVTAISSVGTTSSSVVSYDATLTLDQRDSRVKAGMSASASVIVHQAQGVTVPNDAVSGNGSLATVNVSRGGKTVSQQVVVGLKGDSRTQIVSGLRAGDQLVVTTTLPSLGSSSSGSSSSGSNGTLGGASRLGGRRVPRAAAGSPAAEGPPAASQGADSGASQGATGRGEPRCCAPSARCATSARRPRRPWSEPRASHLTVPER